MFPPLAPGVAVMVSDPKKLVEAGVTWGAPA